MIETIGSGSWCSPAVNGNGHTIICNGVDPRALAPRVLPGDALSEGTVTAIARAESASTGLALLLVSPDFLRR